jgi:hypothetical protein
MPYEPLHIFDPRRTMHVQGFSGRAATTTIHDATETGLSISGIFQAVRKDHTARRVGTTR